MVILSYRTNQAKKSEAPAALRMPLFRFYDPCLAFFGKWDAFFPQPMFLLPALILRGAACLNRICKNIYLQKNVCFLRFLLDDV